MHELGDPGIRSLVLDGLDVACLLWSQGEGHARERLRELGDARRRRLLRLRDDLRMEEEGWLRSED